MVAGLLGCRYQMKEIRREEVSMRLPTHFVEARALFGANNLSRNAVDRSFNDNI